MAQKRFSAWERLEREVAAAEKAHGHIEGLLRVVVAFQDIARP